MHLYLLDTGPLAAYLLGRSRAVATIDPWLNRHEVATSILVYAEVIEYLKSLPDFPTRRAQVRRQFQEIRPYFLTYAILERYADIRRALRPPHGPGLIGDVDTLIAATALERNLTLVSADRDFTRVAGLKLLQITTR
jgi:predicted nucleic acid-binding protein